MLTNFEIHSKYALALCFIVLGIAAVVSIGWITGELEISGFGTKYIPMWPLTAILFRLSA